MFCGIETWIFITVANILSIANGITSPTSHKYPGEKPFVAIENHKKSPQMRAFSNLVGTSGLEPPTPTMSRWCSNQLSYVPA